MIKAPFGLLVGHKIAAGFALALLALLIIGTSSLNNLTRMQRDNDWVSHTLEVKERLEELDSNLVRSESTARGYLITPDPAFRENFLKASNEVNALLKKIQILTWDNKVQQANLAELAPVLKHRLDISASLTAPSKPKTTPGFDPANVAIVKEGESTTALARALIASMKEEEDRLLVIRQANSESAAAWTKNVIGYGSGLAILILSGIAIAVTRSITGPLRVLSNAAQKIGAGDYANRVPVKSRDEVGVLGNLFNQMAEQVEQRQITLSQQDWLNGCLAKFAVLFEGQNDIRLLCQKVLSELSPLMDARHSVMYVHGRKEQGDRLALTASYGSQPAREELRPGEGLVGQCYLEKHRILLHDLPDNYSPTIHSGLGAAPPRTLVVQPILFAGEVKAVLELATLQDFTELQLTLLQSLVDRLGVALITIERGQRTQELLTESQVLGASLAKQADHLRQSEMQLQEQQEELKQSNEELEQLNEELQQTNEEMEEKVNLLAEQKFAMQKVNQEIEMARLALVEKSRQISLASKYKSDFLSNMSHELRTPLNSLLILSKLLADNQDRNLSAKQVDYARTIYSSGNDLLQLINEVLDLSKIESGNIEIEPQPVAVADVVQFTEQNFRHVAESRQIDFQVTLDPSTPPLLVTDERRLQQVIKNLLSNAFKFTEKGSVKFTVACREGGWNPQCEWLNRAEKVLAFSVSDTGIGIPVDKQKIIFEAFQQAEAGVSRKYGGTGLGLSISREISGLLQGSLELESAPGKGSVFTLFLPVAGVLAPTPPVRATKSMPLSATRQLALQPTGGLEDDRGNLHPGDTVLLVIEDDASFAKIIRDVARERKFKVVVSPTVAEGLNLARQLRPSAITLDLQLPDNEGWVVLEKLKQDPLTQEIPIHVISNDGNAERSSRMGAVSCFAKPMTKEHLDEVLNQIKVAEKREVKNLLIIEDDVLQRKGLTELIGQNGVHTVAVGLGSEALQALETTAFDCVVVDLGLPDLAGARLIKEIHRKLGPKAPPIIVYTGRDLSREEETELRLISESIVLKDVRSPERLLDETALFLHRVQAKLPEPPPRPVDEQKNDSILAHRKVLVVDDDVRNIFAITSALESSMMEVGYAESGQASLDYLQKHPDVEIVLMDVMMPGMDGFETIRRIRQLEPFKKLPIISVTAKAMKGDREKCLEAGASDYITKPVDMNQLRSLLRVWLYK